MNHLAEINYLLKLFDNANRQKSVWCDINLDSLTMNQSSQLLFNKAISDLNSLQKNLNQYSIINIKKKVLKLPNLMIPQIIIQFTMPNNSYLNAYPLTLEVSYKYETSFMVESNKDEMKQNEIVLRPRMKCLLYHMNIVNYGLFDKCLFNTEHKKKYNLNFDNIENVFKSIYWILNNSIIPINEMYSIQFIEDTWKQHFLSHNNDICKCSFLYAFPCNWNQYNVCKDIEQKNKYIGEIYSNVRQNEINKIVSYQNIINIAIKNYQPLHKELFNKQWNWNIILDANFLKLFHNSKKSAIERKKFIQNFTKPHIKDRVYSFKLFTDTFCDMLYEELNNYEKYTDLPKQRPNSMNNYGVVLNYIGLEPFITDLCDNFLNIVAEWIFPCKNNLNSTDSNFTYYGTLDHHYTFTVEYELGADIFLDMHIDDSEITFNINLFDKFDGAQLAICGLSGEKMRRSHLLNYSNKKSYCLMHSGKQRHGAKPLTDGKRCNLIIWSKSSWYRTQIGKRFYQRHQNENIPDIICLSQQHDHDYQYWLQKYTKKNKGQKIPTIGNITHEST